MKVQAILTDLGALIKKILKPEQKRRLSNFIKPVEDDEDFIMKLMSILNEA